MIYLIKLIYSFILPPGIFILLLAGISLWLWKRERKPALLLLAVTLVMYLSATSWVGGMLMGSLERKYPQPNALKGDIIVVLGGGATSGTPDLDGEGNLSGSAANRLLTAARLHRSSGLPILISGGKVFSDTGNEAEISRRQLQALGIPNKDIFIENQSLNTEQNAKFTAEQLMNRGFSEPVLVTSAFHLPRAIIEFKQAGLIVQPYPTDYWTSRPEKLYASKFTPSSTGLSLTATALKEYLGLLAATF
ncbi:YdcF family protein [Paenibacillus wynnii]|uniref:Membrane protein n=1 Tax=Paenibacillus wynnii TaxID=268407 RepID=A0A098M577_9BACL|nr:YdcF family protein [Paenibacillus wynnii]KGE17700.1 membrane protein [Paenibacillus wynnii]